MTQIFRRVICCVFASAAIIVTRTPWLDFPALAVPRLLAGTTSAQQTRDSLVGIVTDQRGAAVADAPVQIKHKERGAIVRTRSAADGRFTFANLPAGTYELSINLPCCLYRAFRRTDISLAAGQTSRIDVHLEEGSSLNTVGDDPGALREM